MEYYVKSVVPMIESNYDNFTLVERTIADFFIRNRKRLIFPQKRSLSFCMFRRRLSPVLPRSAVIGDIVNSCTSMKKPLWRSRNP